MAEAKDCPRCKLVNPPDAQRCDCGWDFVSGRQEQSYLEDFPRRGGQLSRQDLYDIAVYQKIILWCILAYIIAAIAQFAVPPEVRIVFGLVFLTVGVVATVFVFMLAIKLYSVAMGIVLGVLTLIPFFGLIALLIINHKATRLLNRHGCRVGLMGANLSQLKDASRAD